MFSGIGVTELILILVIALVVFGPGKLPDVGRALGKSIREFRNAEKNIVLLLSVVFLFSQARTIESLVAMKNRLRKAGCAGRKINCGMVVFVQSYRRKRR